MHNYVQLFMYLGKLAKHVTSLSPPPPPPRMSIFMGGPELVFMHKYIIVLSGLSYTPDYLKGDMVI